MDSPRATRATAQQLLERLHRSSSLTVTNTREALLMASVPHELFIGGQWRQAESLLSLVALFFAQLHDEAGVPAGMDAPRSSRQGR